jgi:hypothetical protein
MFSESWGHELLLVAPCTVLLDGEFDCRFQDLEDGDQQANRLHKFRFTPSYIATSPICALPRPGVRSPGIRNSMQSTKVNQVPLPDRQ